MSKILTLSWFLLRPPFYWHALALVRRKFLPNYDVENLRQKSRRWASENAMSKDDLLRYFSLDNQDIDPIDPDLLRQAYNAQKACPMPMGGAAYTELLYDIVKRSRAQRVIETGVAYGWSSLAILSALQDCGTGRLISIDMPYVRRGNEKFVGIVVPEYLWKNWTLLREPDRRGIEKAIRILREIDVAHYDSDKSWWGRMYAYPRLWDALRPGGFLISDDIQDNFAFLAFAQRKKGKFAVVESQGKHVGIIQKPL